MADLRTLSKDKEFLSSIISNGFSIPEGIDPYEFCIELLPNLGSTDPELRDELTYTILESLVANPEKITTDQAGRILSVCLDDEHLLYGISERDRDSVFMRSFSALLAGAIIDRDTREKALDPLFVRDSLDRLLQYSAMERDYRGFVHGKGWAHSIAHLADALHVSSLHPAMTQQQLERIVERTGAISSPEYPLSNGEDDRLSYPACNSILRISDRNFILNWIDNFPGGGDPSGTIYRKHNAQHFLRSLYFQIKWKNGDNEILERIEKKLKSFDWQFKEEKEDA